ncbi:MAG: SDR family NAD(P)-dependent oxidoreductase [Microthrixaceae bacterium]
MAAERRPHVVVTGAGGGLGAATARLLSLNGWSVIAADLPSDTLERVADRDDVISCETDVTRADSVAALSELARNECDGRLEAVVNFAGVLEIGSMAEMDIETLRRVLEVNVVGTYRVNKSLFDQVVAARGRIVNISSETGWQSGGPFNGAYAMSKHAIEAYSDSLRREAALVGVKVIKVQPGPFRTAMVESVKRRFEDAAVTSRWFAAELRRTGELAAGEQDRAHPPVELAEVVLDALRVDRPKAAYSVHPATSRVLLEKLPTRLGDAAIARALTSRSRRKK